MPQNWRIPVCGYFTIELPCNRILYERIDPVAARIREIKIRSAAKGADNKEEGVVVVPMALRHRIPIEIIHKMLLFLLHPHN